MPKLKYAILTGPIIHLGIWTFVKHLLDYGTEWVVLNLEILTDIRPYEKPKFYARQN
jgi:hypothetical protein